MVEILILILAVVVLGIAVLSLPVALAILGIIGVGRAIETIRRGLVPAPDPALPRRVCASCLYDITDLPSPRCPECGRDLTPDSAARAPRAPKPTTPARVVLAWLFLVALVWTPVMLGMLRALPPLAPLTLRGLLSWPAVLGTVVWPAVGLLACVVGPVVLLRHYQKVRTGP